MGAFTPLASDVNVTVDGDGGEAGPNPNWVEVYNPSGSVMPVGTAGYLTSNGTFFEIFAVDVATIISNGAMPWVVVADIPGTSTGYATQQGYIEDFDTSSYVLGQELYFNDDPSGDGVITDAFLTLELKAAVVETVDVNGRIVLDYASLPATVETLADVSPTTTTEKMILIATGNPAIPWEKRRLSLYDIEDIDLDTNPPADGDVLAYDEVSGLFVPVTPSSGGGGSSTIDYVAGETLGGHRVVKLVDDEAFYASADEAGDVNIVYGITTGAISVGDEGPVQFEGIMTEGSWSWTPGLPIYLGLNGVLTQTYPAEEFSLIVAFPLTATKIQIRFREPIITI